MGRHGHITDYRSGCESCRERSLTQSQRRRRRVYGERELIDGRLTATRDVPHGVVHTYTHYGCRCWPCSLAQSKFMKNYRRGHSTYDGEWAEFDDEE